MSEIKNRSTKESSVIKAVLISVICSGALFLGATGALASFMVKGNFSGDMAGKFAIIALCLGSLFCSWIGVKVLHHGALLCALVSFALYGVLPMLVSVILGEFETASDLIARMIILLVCSFAGGILGTQKIIGKRKVG